MSDKSNVLIYVSCIFLSAIMSSQAIIVKINELLSFAINLVIEFFCVIF